MDFKKRYLTLGWVGEDGQYRQTNRRLPSHDARLERVARFIYRVTRVSAITNRLHKRREFAHLFRLLPSRRQRRQTARGCIARLHQWWEGPEMQLDLNEITRLVKLQHRKVWQDWAYRFMLNALHGTINEGMLHTHWNMYGGFPDDDREPRQC